MLNGMVGGHALFVKSKYEDIFFTSNGTFTIPIGARRLMITCIGGGGGSGGVAHDYGEGVAASGGGGGTGEKTDRVLNIGEFTPGASIAVTVGSAGVEGGAWSPAGSGGNSSFGAFLSARGGTGGSPGVTQWGAYGRGGDGGAGGIGGSPGRSPLGENYGNYGGSYNSDFGNWTDKDWYVFGDPNTGKRLGAAGKGGAAKGGSGPGPDGRGNIALPGTWYGTGGGGRNWWGGTGVWWAAMQGIVAVRVFYTDH